MTWLFGLDHPYYARWLPVHIHDMMKLDKTHPDRAVEFVKENFVVIHFIITLVNVYVDLVIFTRFFLPVLHRPEV